MTTQTTWIMPLVIAFAVATAPHLALAQDAAAMGPIVSDIEQLTGQAPEVAPPPSAPTEAPLAPPPAAIDAPPAEYPAGNVIAEPERAAEEDLLFLEDDAPVPVATKTTSESGMELISISLDDVPLEDVVRMFTRVSGANIIATATNLEGTVTVNLVDVEWKPALTSILDMHNLSLTEKIPGSGVYSILPRQADAPEPMLVETLFLQFTTVDDVVPLLKTIIVPGATVSPFKSRNAFVLKTTSSNIGEVKQILKLVDIPGEQVCIEAKFMELSDAASKQLGIRWDSLNEFNVRAGLGPFTYDRTTEKKNIDTDSVSKRDNRARTDTLTKYYDANGNQFEVVEDVKVVDLTDTDSLVLSTLIPTTEIGDIIDSGEDLESSTVNTFTETINESQSAILAMDEFSIVLSALKTTEGVSVISNPKLIVANGEVGAFFSSGSREPIIKTELRTGTTDSPGDTKVSALDTGINTDFIKEGYLETGIILNVRPVVKAEGLIEAEVEPSLRRKTGDKFVGDEGNSWPIISVKEIKTRFTLLDGQTVAIGGLTDTADTKQTSKVPLLGDIPFIGKYLFSHTKDVTSQTETIIFVTLSLARPEGIVTEQGIPEDAELVHRRMLQNKAHRAQFKSDLQKMREAIEAETRDVEGGKPSALTVPKTEASKEVDATAATEEALIKPVVPESNTPEPTAEAEAPEESVQEDTSPEPL